MSFNPNQPRVPAGSSEGGQFARGDIVSITGRSAAFKVARVGEAGVHVKTLMGSDVGILSPDKLKLLRKAAPPVKAVKGTGETLFAPLGGLTRAAAERIVQTADYQPWAVVKDAEAALRSFNRKPGKK